METPKWAKELASKSNMKVTRCTSCGCPVLEDYDRFVEVYDSVPYPSASARQFFKTGQHPAKIVTIGVGSKTVIDVWKAESITADAEYLLIHDCGRLKNYLTRVQRRRSRRKAAVQPALIPVA